MLRNVPMKPNALKVLRAGRNMNQFEAAKAIGVSLTRWFRIEHRQTEPRAEEIAAIAGLFEAEPATFYEKPERDGAAA